MSKLTEQVYRTLRRQIMSGDLPPGAQVKEEHVAATLDVSRTPVRAALQRLTADGLLINRERRGAFVAEWTHRDIEEIFELRVLLESQAAGRAALNATAEQIAELGALTDAMDRLARDKPVNYLGDIEAANNRFHHLILVSSGSPRLRALAAALVDIPLVVGAFFVYTDDDLQRSIQHHRDLLVAIEHRNRGLAQEIMSVHLRMAHLIVMRAREAGAAQSAPAPEPVAGR